MQINLENKKQIVTVILAVALGLVASLLAAFYINKENEKNANKLAKQLEQDRIKLEQTRLALSQEVQMVRRDMQQMEAQILSKVKQAPEEKSQMLPSIFALRTPPGKRALTIMIDSLNAVGGLIGPGDFVDILAHLKIPETEEASAPQKSVTTILFQNIQVLAVGTNFQIGASDTTYDIQQRARSLNITLALTQEEAGLLTFSQAHGNLQFSLRAPTEKDVEPYAEVASWEALADFVSEKQGTELLPPKKKEIIIHGIPEEVPQEEPYTIQIFKSGRQSQ